MAHPNNGILKDKNVLRRIDLNFLQEILPPAILIFREFCKLLDWIGHRVILSQSTDMDAIGDSFLLKIHAERDERLARNIF